jgi:carboxypeptidase C (cathepsin A)
MKKIAKTKEQKDLSVEEQRQWDLLRKIREEQVEDLLKNGYSKRSILSLFARQFSWLQVTKENNKGVL